MVNPLINPPIRRSLMFLIAVGAVALQPLEKANAFPEKGVSPTVDTTQISEANGIGSSDRNDLAPQLSQTADDLNPSYSSYSPLEKTLPASEASLEASDDVSHIEPLTKTIPSQAQKIPVTPRAEPASLETPPSQRDQLQKLRTCPPDPPILGGGRLSSPQGWGARGARINEILSNCVSLKLLTQATDAQEMLPEETLPEETPPFGEAGQKYWYLQGAGAVSFDPDDDGTTVFGLVGAGISQFFADGLSITLELNQMGFIQSGEDALGLNLSSQLRWHFYRQPKWSVYIDGGAGILGTTSDVPSSGSQFNFTPQVGAGATINLRGAEQLMVGVRWHHISNAELYEANPGRDSILFYGGWIMPR